MSFWMTNAVVYDDGEVAYDNSSKLEPKRPHQLFMDGTESELYPNKKQATEIPVQNPFSGYLNADICQLGNSSGIQPAMSISERLFNPENVIPSFDERNIQVVGSCNTNMGRKVTDNCTLMGLSYDRDNVNLMTMNDAYNSAVDGFISMGQSCNKLDDATIDQFIKKRSNVVSMNLSSGKEDDNDKSLGSSLQDSDVTIPMDQLFNGGDDSAFSIAQNFTGYQTNNKISMNNSYSKLDEGAFPMGPALSTGQSFVKTKSNIISFASRDSDGISSSGRLTCNYDFLMGRSLVQGPTLSEKCLVKSNIEAVAGVAKMTSAGSVLRSKSKEDRNGPTKVHPNNFPSNVRSLLSTGMLEGVPVKYLAWSKQKELNGIIRSCGYLCGCQSCNLSKAINAFEFERHAGCKTKHPNNHIYFESGKTIYGVVQELRNTPQHLLFEVMQTITGSTINQKAFQLWRESFQAANRELQRIYGEDEGEQFP